MTQSSGKTLNVLIVEDEAPARALLSKWLSGFEELNIVGVAGTLKAAKAHIDAANPDVVFLDIELPDGTGFGLFEDLAGVRRPYVIFTTAYDAYAAQAFRIDAVDYLVKPFDREQLAEAIERVIRRFRSDYPVPSGNSDQFKNILRIKHRGQTVLVLASDIEYLKSEDYYTAVHVSGRQYLSRTPLKTFGTQLRKFGFVQVHRSFIVNIAHVSAMNSLSGGDAEVTMETGCKIRMSRRYRGELESLLKNYSLKEQPSI